MKIDKTHLIIKTDNGQDYEINLKQINTVAGLEKWLCHMTEKNWFTMIMAKEMVRMCENHFNYKFNGKYSYVE